MDGGLRRRAPRLVATLACVMAGGLGMSSAAEAANCGFLGLFCPAPKPPTQCTDGVDNDKDGSTDAADAGCPQSAGVSEYVDLAPDANGRPSGQDVDPARSGKVFGFNSHLGLWSSWSAISPAREADLVRTAGGMAQRLPIRWSHMQPTSAAPMATRFATIDATYGALAARGMVPVFNIVESPVWASDYATCKLLDFKCYELQRNPPPNLPPANLEAYADFIEYLARRYPGSIIEGWNEPNIARFWNVKAFPNTARMAAMQCLAFDRIKKVDPQRTVLSPGFSFIGANPSSGQIPYVDYVAGMHSHMKRRCWDGISVHVYPTSKVDGEGSSTATAMRAIRAIKTRFADPSKVWVTETGASTSGDQTGDHGHTDRTPEEQARMVQLTINELLTTDDVGAVLVHTVRDRPDSEGTGSTTSSVQWGFGLLYNDTDDTPVAKPAWCRLLHARGVAYPGCVDGQATEPPPDGTTTTAARSLSTSSRKAKKVRKRPVWVQALSDTLDDLARTAR